MKKIIYLILVAFIISCNSDKKMIEDENARYEINFNINWNEQDFPNDYPSNAHFSRLIGWSHKSNSAFFQTGTFASEGIKKMAESGSTSPLENEIKDRIANNESLSFIVGEGLSSGVGTIKIELEVNKENSSVTLCTMIAPSPDWYIAVVNINLYNDGKFIQEKTVTGLIYDAGTDSGVTFKSGNEVTNPSESINLFVKPPLGNGLLITPNIAEVTFSKI